MPFLFCCYPTTSLPVSPSVIFFLLHRLRFPASAQGGSPEKLWRISGSPKKPGTFPFISPPAPFCNGRRRPSCHLHGDALSSSTLVLLLLSGSTFVLEALRMHCSSFSLTWLRLSDPRFSFCHLIVLLLYWICCCFPFLLLLLLGSVLLRAGEKDWSHRV